MKKKYSEPKIKSRKFVIDTSYCEQEYMSGITSNQPKDEEKEDMNGWSPWS